MMQRTRFNYEKYKITNYSRKDNFHFKLSPVTKSRRSSQLSFNAYALAAYRHKLAAQQNEEKLH